MNTKLRMKVRKFNSLFLLLSYHVKVSFIKAKKKLFFLSELQNKLCYLGIIADQNVRLIKQAHDRDQWPYFVNTVMKLRVQ
jgi:hypothetical protein